MIDSSLKPRNWLMVFNRWQACPTGTWRLWQGLRGDVPQDSHSTPSTSTHSPLSPFSLFFSSPPLFRRLQSACIGFTSLSGWVDVVTGLEREGYTVSLFCHPLVWLWLAPDTCILPSAAHPINHCPLPQHSKKFSQGDGKWSAFTVIYFCPGGCLFQCRDEQDERDVLTGRDTSIWAMLEFQSKDGGLFWWEVTCAVDVELMIPSELNAFTGVFEGVHLWGQHNQMCVNSYMSHSPSPPPGRHSEIGSWLVHVLPRVCCLPEWVAH